MIGGFIIFDHRCLRSVPLVAVETEPAKPATGQVEVNLLAQASLRADPEAVADEQHPDHQLGIDQGPIAL
jgi:hypothetical protein